MYIHIYIYMPAMDGQWRSSRIVSVRNNKVLNKH